MSATEDHERHPASPGSGPPQRRPRRAGERRWPMAAAVLSFGALNALLPDDFRIVPPWAFQSVLVLFLVVLVAGDPGRIDRERPWLRVVTNALIGFLTLANAFGIARLVDGILEGARFTDAPDLLRIGTVLWAGNVITFALWFWDLDAGGAAARAAGSTRHTRALAFPETDLPEHADGAWYPQFVDYLAVSFNTATAFSPTDVSAVKRWAKLLMMAESVLSLLIALLVFARAINIWPTAGS